MKKELVPVTEEGWVIQNLRTLRDGITGNYNSVVPEDAIKTLGGIQNTIRAIAYAGDWDDEDISIHEGDPDIWGDEVIHIVERRPARRE